MNANLADTLTALDGLLAATLDVDNYFDLDQLHRPADPGRLAFGEPAPVEAAFLPPAPKGAVADDRQCRPPRAGGSDRPGPVPASLRRARGTGTRSTRRARPARGRQPSPSTGGRRAEAGRRCGLPEAVVTYVDLVLNASLYPDGFPQHWRLAYVPESRQLVVEYDLPGIDAIPPSRPTATSRPPTASLKRRARKPR